MHRVIYITSSDSPLISPLKAADNGRLDVVPVSNDNVPASFDGFDAVLIGTARLSRPVTDLSDNGPKLVQLTRGHHPDVNAAALIAAGVTVAGASPVLAPGIADHALTNALVIRPGRAGKMTGGESAHEKTAGGYVSDSLVGLTVGIVGFGRTGTAMANLCASLGATVIYSDIRTAPHDSTTTSRARRSTLDLLLTKSDIVSLHVQWGPTSNPLLGERELRLISPEAVLVNTADSRLVDNEALAVFLRNRRIGGAVLDIEGPGRDQLNGIPGVVISSPCVPQHNVAYEDLAEYLITNIETGLTGGSVTGELEIIDFPRSGDPAFWSSKMSPRVG